MRTQRRSELLTLFHEEYVPVLRRDEDMDVGEAINSLERIETHLRVGWHDDAVTEISEFEDRYGIEFERLVAETQSNHLAELRQTENEY